MNFPMKFRTSAKAASGIETTWIASPESQPSARNIPVSIPTEFGGPNTGFSPEDLIGFAAANCYIATFQVYAKNSKLSFKNIEVSSLVTIDLNAQKLPHITGVELDVHLSGTDNADRAQRLMEKVSKNCIVLNALGVEKSFKFKIE